MVLPSLATPAPGMLLLQHSCQHRAQVCVHCSQGLPSSPCLVLWGSFALSSAQGLSPFPSLPTFPHAPQLPKKKFLPYHPGVLSQPASEKPAGCGGARE